MTKTKKLKYANTYRRMLVPGLAIILLAAVGSYFVFQSYANPPNLEGTEDINRISMHVGPEERVAGPTNAHDTPYTIQMLAGKPYGMTGNGDSYKFELDPETLLHKNAIPHNKETIPNNKVLLTRDKAVPFAVRARPDPNSIHPDACGAWVLGSMYRFKAQPGHVIGWYHGENECLRERAEDAGSRTHMTLAFAESFDAGKTWQKPGYPNNRIITVERALQNDPAQNDTGNGRVIKIGDYFYIFYQGNSTQNSGTGRMIHVARSKVSDKGKPGTWKKWYCSNPAVKTTCNFDHQPGIGGKSTPLRNVGDQYVTFNRYLNRYIAVSAHGDGFTLNAASGSDTSSEEGIKNLLTTWKRKSETFYPAVTNSTDPTVNNWDRCPGCKQLYAYNSLIGVAGNSRGSGKSFYLYYLKLFPNEKFENGYIMRRKVELSLSDATTKTTRVELSSYKNSAGQQRISTELPQPSTGYTKYDKKIGYALASYAEGYRPLFECQKPNGQFYLKLVNTTQPDGVPVPGDVPTMCTSTHKLIRRVGWVSPTKTSEASVPIYDTSNIPASSRSAAIGFALSR